MINFFIGFLVALSACAISGIILSDYSYSKGFTQGYITAKQLKDLADEIEKLSIHVTDSEDTNE